MFAERRSDFRLIKAISSGIKINYYGIFGGFAMCFWVFVQRHLIRWERAECFNHFLTQLFVSLCIRMNSVLFSAFMCVRASMRSRKKSIFHNYVMLSCGRSFWAGSRVFNSRQTRRGRLMYRTFLPLRALFRTFADRRKSRSRRFVRNQSIRENVKSRKDETK